MLNSRAWFQKYLPALRRSASTIAESEPNIQIPKEEPQNTSLVTDSLPLLSAEGQYLASDDIEDNFIGLEDWNVYGEEWHNNGHDFDWDSEDSDDSTTDFEAPTAYENLKSIPPEPPSTSTISGLCSDKRSK